MYGGVKNEPLLSLYILLAFLCVGLGELRCLLCSGCTYPKTFYSVLSKSLVIEQRSVAVPHPTVYYYTIILRIYVVYGSSSSSSRAAKSLRKGRIKEQSAAKLLRSAVLSLFFFFNFSWWAVSVAGTLLTLLNILWILNFDSVFGKRQNIYSIS